MPSAAFLFRRDTDDNQLPFHNPVFDLAEREPLLEIHPDDAARRDIVDRDLVRVYHDRGAVEAHVRIGDRVPPGVVSLPSGWWASLSPGGSSANTLTADGLSDWGGGGDFHDALVEVAPLDEL